MINIDPEIIFDLIEYLKRTERISSLFSKRLNDSNTEFIGFHCNQYKRHPSDANKVTYILKYYFGTTIQEYNYNDDINVLVEIDVKSKDYKILNITTF